MRSDEDETVSTELMRRVCVCVCVCVCVSAWLAAAALTNQLDTE